MLKAKITLITIYQPHPPLKAVSEISAIWATLKHRCDVVTTEQPTTVLKKAVLKLFEQFINELASWQVGKGRVKWLAACFTTTQQQQQQQLQMKL